MSATTAGKLPRTARREPAPRARAPGTLRVLIVSHGHPRYTRGGAEIAAYALYQGLLAQPGCDAWFLGCQPEPAASRIGVGITQPLGEREYVYQAGDFAFFNFANRDPNFPDEFIELLRELRPDVVHFHHFLFFGIEAFALVRRALPQARIVLTLHEYLLICNALGQMVTRKDHGLCYAASTEACHDCFPEIPAADFFLRTTYIRRFIAEVDRFIAPSRFLAGRLGEWGLPPDRIDILENVVGPALESASDPAAVVAGPLRVGFFGQISRLKGMTVLFEAAARLEAVGADVVFDIHGTYRGQPPEVEAEFQRLLAAAGTTVRYHGGYRPQDVDVLMRRVDLVLVPSIWWENSPVVIQEARRNRRPVVCSDIGGMAEKVVAGRDGWHFPTGSSPALAALLQALAADRSRILGMQASLGRVQPMDDAVQAHHALYTGLRCAGPV